MIDSALALMAAFVFAVGVVLMRKGLSNSNVSSGLIVTTLVGNIILWPMVLIRNPQSSFSIYGLLVFGLAGLFHPGMARLLYYLGMLKVGVPGNASIFTINSVFSVLFAILLLNEKSTFILWIGLAFVVVGAAIVESSVSIQEGLKVKRRTLVIPVITSVIASLGWVLKKIGLNVYSEPLQGVAVAYLVSLILYTLLFCASTKTRSVTQINTRTFRLFWKAGLCISIGYLLLFFAMQWGSVSVVTPLVQTEPLFILILAYFYLKTTESFSKKLVFGALSIVLGVMLITAFGV